MAKRKLVLYILSGILILGIAGVFVWALATGKIKPKADESAYAAGISQEELKNSGFAIVQLPPEINSLTVNELSGSSSKNRNANLEESNKKIQNLIDSALIQQQVDNQQTVQNQDGASQPIDQIVILTDQAGNPILPDAQKAKEKGTSLFRGENELTFEYSDDWQGEQLEQLKAAIASIYPKVKELYGSPAFSNTVKIIRDNSHPEYAGYYVPATNTLALNVDSIENFNSANYAFEVVIHEMTHAFHDDYCFLNKPWEEGMTQAATTIVLNKMTGQNKSIGWISSYEENNFPSWFQTNWSFYIDTVFPYRQGAAAWAKIYYENKDFFKNINKKYYEASLDHGSKEKVLFDTISTVEGLPTTEWYAQQQIFHSDNSGLIKIEMEHPYLPNCYFSIYTPRPDQNINVKIYDANSQLISQNNATTIAINDGLGWIRIFPTITNMGNMQKVKIVTTITDDNKSVENYEIIYPSYPGPTTATTIYGITPGFNSGQVTAKNLGDNNMQPVTVNINNGVFEFGEQAKSAGKWELTYRDASGTKTSKKIINKGEGSYYAILPYHSVEEINSLKQSLNNAQKTVVSNALSINYQLPSTYINYFVNRSDNVQYGYKEFYKNDFNTVNVTMFGLVPNSNYKNQIFAFFPDNFMVSSNPTEFKTQDTLQIIGINPSSGSNNAKIDSPIVVTFDKPININSGTFVLSKVNGGRINGSISLDSEGKILTFTPSNPLEYNAEYNFKVENFKSTTGLGLWQNEEGYFWTQLAPDSSVAPEILSFSPDNGNENVSADSKIKIIFNTNVDLNQDNINKIKITARGDYNEQLPGSFSYDDQGKILIFSPSEPLSYNSNYSIMIRGIKDGFGNDIHPYYYASHFKTGYVPGSTIPLLISENPANSSANNFCDKSIRLTFNNPIDPTSLAYTMSNSSALIYADTSFENNQKTIVFTPKQNYFIYSYVFLWLESLKDVYGNYIYPEDNQYHLAFTTGNKYIKTTSSENSQFSVDPKQINPDGIQKAKITVVLKDSENNPVIGKNVVLLSSGKDDVIIQPNDAGGGGLTNNDGVTYGYISSKVVGKSEVSAIDITSSDNQIVLNNKVTVEFKLANSEIKLYAKTGNEGNLVSFVTNGPNISGWDSKNDHIYQWVNNKWKEIKTKDIQAGIGYKITVRQNKNITISGGTAPTLPLLTRFAKGQNYIGNPTSANISAKDVVIKKSRKICKWVWLWPKCSWNVKEYSLAQAVNAKIIDKMITYTDSKNSNSLVTTTNQITDNFVFYPGKGYGINVLEKTDNSNNIIEIIFRK